MRRPHGWCSTSTSSIPTSSFCSATTAPSRPTSRSGWRRGFPTGLRRSSIGPVRPRPPTSRFTSGTTDGESLEAPRPRRYSGSRPFGLSRRFERALPLRYGRLTHAKAGRAKLNGRRADVREARLEPQERSLEQHVGEGGEAQGQGEGQPKPQGPRHVDVEGHPLSDGLMEDVEPKRDAPQIDRDRMGEEPAPGHQDHPQHDREDEVHRRIGPERRQGADIADRGAETQERDHGGPADGDDRDTGPAGKRRPWRRLPARPAPSEYDAQREGLEPTEGMAPHGIGRQRAAEQMRRARRIQNAPIRARPSRACSWSSNAVMRKLLRQKNRSTP